MSINSLCINPRPTWHRFYFKAQKVNYGLESTFPIYLGNGHWDLGISAVVVFVVIPVPPHTHLVCACRVYCCETFTWMAGDFIHSHTYQSGQAFYLISHSKSVSEFTFPLFLPQISCRERLLRLTMRTYKPCSWRHWPIEAVGPSQKVWEALCWGMGRGLVLLC